MPFSGVPWGWAVSSYVGSLRSVGHGIDAFAPFDSTRIVSVLATVLWCVGNKQTPLGPIEEAALERLRVDYEPVDDRFSRAVAVDTVSERDLEPAVAHTVLDRLLSKGYLYAVDDELYITD